VVEAVRRQSEAAEAARGLSDELKKLVGVLAARIDELANQSAGGTREVVVAAVLRSEVSSLTAAVNKSVEAATATDASENFRLETHDRQLRGLRTRLAQRRDAVHQQLQLEADRVARQKLMQERDASRDRVRALEQQRDELTGALMARADDLRIIDQDVLKRSRAEAQLNELGARGAWLRTRIQQLDEKLALLRRRGPKPDRIELGDTALLLLTPDRYAHAAAAAGVACVATALVGFLMVARNPLRRRHRELIAWVGSPAGRQFQPEPIPRP
jgi:chromosome segregation ATPase